jgi:hypothetical protein
MRRVAIFLLFHAAFPQAAWAQSPAGSHPHNVVLFVADGLRSAMVNPQNAPEMAALRAQGVDFRNSHSMFPTFTMPNSSAMASGHYLGDTGIFSNTLYAGFAVKAAGGTVTPFIENDAVLAELDEHFGGNFSDETAIVKAARDAGLGTALIGKVGPTLLFDHAGRDSATIVFDDATGTPSGVVLPPAITEALAAANLAAAAPGRGDNGKAGDFKTPGTTVANVTQQDYFADVATKVVLPLLKAKGAPFLLVFWSRDPDGSQHNQGDSLGQVVPGINGPTSLAAIRNADSDLAKIRAALAQLDLADSTDVIVTADHGFSTISRESRSSGAAKASYADVKPGMLPPGFVAIDLANALGMPLFDPNNSNAPVGAGSHPKSGNALLGSDANAPDLAVAANGGSDLVYLLKRDQALAARIVKALSEQDYVSGLFVDSALGKIPGTLPLESVNLKGAALTPLPSIVVNFRTHAEGCDIPTNCQVEIADTGLQQGQGMHGSFGRGDTFNFTAAAGPDFKQGFIDPAPVSNADVGRTIAHILKLEIPAKGMLAGRVMIEAMPGGKVPPFVAKTLRSAPGINGLRTILNYQLVGATRYFDAAGFPGRTLGLNAAAPAKPPPPKK